jgi:hypothetical protein
MEHGPTDIVSPDRGFDDVTEVQRITPEDASS